MMPTQEPLPLDTQSSKRDAVPAAAVLHRYRRRAGQQPDWPVDRDFGAHVASLPRHTHALDRATPLSSP